MVDELFDEKKRDSAIGRIGGMLERYFDGDASKLAQLLDPTRMHSPLHQFRLEIAAGFKGIEERLVAIEAAAAARGAERARSAAKGADFDALLESMLGDLARGAGDLLGGGLVEIHGQHDERGFLNPRGHRALLDVYGAIDRSEVEAAWEALEARSARESVGQEHIEVLEARALYASRLGQRERAMRQLDKAIAAASRIPNVMSERLRRRRAELEPAVGRSFCA